MDEQATARPSAWVAAARRKRLWLIVGLAAAVAVVLWRFAAARPEAPANVVFLSGRIEGDDSVISPKTSGRIAEIRFREGDTVKAGDTIAILDDEQVRAREEQARAALSASEARQQSAMSQ